MELLVHEAERFPRNSFALLLHCGTFNTSSVLPYGSVNSILNRNFWRRSEDVFWCLEFQPFTRTVVEKSFDLFYRSVCNTTVGCFFVKVLSY